MKKFLVAASFVFLLHAEVLDKVIASINNIPITSYEVEKTAKQLNISKEKALQVLLDKKLIQSEIKKRGIEVDDFELENAMEKIAKQNGFTLFEFKNILMQRGQYKDFVKNLKENLLKQKLFDQIVQTILHINEEDIRNYYNNHKNEFSIFKTIQVTKYTANNRQTLNDIKQNPLMANLKIKPETKVYSYDELPVALMFLFKQTKVGEFTPIINEGLGYSMYYVARKDGNVYIPFDKVKVAIANKLAAEKREQILKDYFGKLKNRAYIKYYN